MRAKRIFILNAVITAGYGIAFLTAAGPLLAVYGIAPQLHTTGAHVVLTSKLAGVLLTTSSPAGSKTFSVLSVSSPCPPCFSFCHNPGC